MPTRNRSLSSKLQPALLMLALSGCATSSPPPSLPPGPLAVTVPCLKPDPAPLPAVEAARRPADFSGELSTLLDDAQKLLQSSTQPSQKP